jgi:hypothetical protein
VLFEDLVARADVEVGELLNLQKRQVDALRVGLDTTFNVTLFFSQKNKLMTAGMVHE